MQINQSPTRQKYPLSPRKVIKKTLPPALFLGIFFIGGFISSLVLSFAVRQPGTSSTLSSGTFLSISLAFLVAYVIIIWLIWMYQKWYYSTYYYNLEDHFIVIKKGPITPHEINVPFQRIQDVYIDQDILDRLLGLYDLHLASATSSSAMEAHIDGLNQQSASDFRDELLQTIHQKLSTK